MASEMLCVSSPMVRRMYFDGDFYYNLTFGSFRCVQCFKPFPDGVYFEVRTIDT